MRAIWHGIRGHRINYSGTAAFIPAIWHHCSCGQRWLA